MPETTAISRKTNAAYRLLIALQSLKSVPATIVSGNMQISRSGLQALPLGFALQPDTTMSSPGWELMRCVKLLAEMIDDLRSEVEAQTFSSEDQRFYLRDLPQIASALGPDNLYRTWADITNNVTPVMLANLENLHRVLNRETVERELTSGDFGTLLAQIEEAKQALQELEIDKEAKLFIEAQLVNIELAIDSYKYRGIKGLQPAIAGYIGALSLAHGALDENTQTTEGKSRLRKLLDVWTTSTGILNTARGVSWIWPYLEHAAQHLHQLMAQAAS